MKSEELKKKIVIGDWLVIAKMLNISPKNAQMSFLRPDSKRYPAIVEALEKLIKSREKLLTNAKDKKNENEND